MYRTRPSFVTAEKLEEVVLPRALKLNAKYKKMEFKKEFYNMDALMLMDNPQNFEIQS